MKQNYVKIIIGLLSFCLAGILGFQIYWFVNAYNVKEEQFDRLVTEALNGVSEKLEDTEAAYIFANSVQLQDSLSDSIAVPPPPPQPNVITSIKKKNKIIKHDSIQKTIEILNHLEDTINEALKKAKIGKFSMSFFEGEDSMKMDFSEDGFSLSICSDDENAEFNISSKIEKALDKIEKKNIKLIDKNKKLKKREEWVKKVVNKMVFNYDIKDFPAEKRIQIKNLEKIIQKELMNKDINTAYEFGVISKTNDSLTALRSKGFKTSMIDSKYKVDLFQRDILQRKDQLVLNFPSKGKFIMTGLSAMMFVQILFTIIIIMTFAGSIMLIVRQKKLSDIKNDFINNMTHEFKTPIATIGLAVDSIDNPKVLENKNAILNFTKVIREENKRMNSHVETILRMALLDKNELTMNFEIVNITEILYQAIAKMRLQIETRNGTISLSEPFENFSVNADPVHIMNVFLNIIDNANKYSQENPSITISTKKIDSDVIISIQDKGIGMSREVSQMIFEKFYRATTGNIHNVKGFGLGLAYAKAVVELHNGQIKVNSEPGIGSTFEIILPAV